LDKHNFDKKQIKQINKQKQKQKYQMLPLIGQRNKNNKTKITKTNKTKNKNKNKSNKSFYQINVIRKRKKSQPFLLDDIKIKGALLR